MPNIRMPAVAGQFYPGEEKNLRQTLDSLIDKKAAKTHVLGCIMPHAGYMYSGRVAGLTASSINLTDKIIILGPNHTGYGKAISIMTEGSWLTPLGEVTIDSDLAKDLLRRSKYLEDDSQAHMYEHSLEVELPFLQYLKKDFKFVPIVMGQGNLNTYRAVGEEIASTIKELNIADSTLIIASSDMTHYESQVSAREKDQQAIDAILHLDIDALWQRVHKLDITMCGYAPVIAMIAACLKLGAKSAKLIKYQTSGDVTGDLDAVVGYAGMVIY